MGIISPFLFIGGFVKIKVYNWRKDIYYDLEGEIIKETFDSKGEKELDYKSPEGTISKRKYIQESYIAQFQTIDNQIIILEHFRSFWTSGKEFQESFRETL